MKKTKYGKQVILGIILISGIVGLVILAVNIIFKINKKIEQAMEKRSRGAYVDTKENHPNQIALGKNSYFLLYLWEGDNDDDARIVQYDYLSNKINESMVTNIASIACRDGYLFVGKWQPDEYDDDDDKDYYPFLKPITTDFMQINMLRKSNLVAAYMI